MKDDTNPVVVAVLTFSGLILFGLGVYAGKGLGADMATTRLTHEAVREKAGTWVAGEQGEAVFKWLACVPAKPTEVKK